MQEKPTYNPIEIIKENIKRCTEELRQQQKPLGELEGLLISSNNNIKNKKINRFYIEDAKPNDDLFIAGSAFDLICETQGRDYALKLLGYKKPETIKEKLSAAIHLRNYVPIV